MIYFIQDTQSRAIKIGYAKNPKKRLAGLQSAIPSKLVLLGTVPGGLDRESAYHQQFDQHRLHGEWFKPDILPAVTAIIAKEAANPSPATTNVIVAGDSELDFMMSTDARQMAEKTELQAAVERALGEIHAKTGSSG